MVNRESVGDFICLAESRPVPGAREEWVPWKIAPGQVVETTNYHRPLSWYFRALRNCGFAVTAFEEPAPTQEFIANSLQGEWIAQIPVHCIIEAEKLPEGLIP